VGPGLFADPGNSIISLPGIEPVLGITVRVIVWTGNYSNWRDAVIAGERNGGGTPFEMRVGSIDMPTASLEGMPALYLGIPEPGILSLMMVGMTVFLFTNRRRQQRGQS
jgi:hypothetical protein